MGERQHDPDKDRIFVRELSGKYSLPLTDGFQAFGRIGLQLVSQKGEWPADIGDQRLAGRFGILHGKCRNDAAVVVGSIDFAGFGERIDGNTDAGARLQPQALDHRDDLA